MDICGRLCKCLLRTGNIAIQSNTSFVFFPSQCLSAEQVIPVSFNWGTQVPLLEPKFKKNLRLIARSLTTAQ